MEEGKAGENRGRMRLLAACLALLAAAPAALAACGGANMLDVLAHTDPAAHAAIMARAEATPNGEGRFWRIDRPDSPAVAPSHLFGTFHTDQATATVPDAAWTALRDARIALFELGAAEQAAMQARLAGDRAFAYDDGAPPLSQRLDADGLAVISRALAARGIPLEAAEPMRPWMLFSLLALPACHLQAMSAGASSLDTVMTARADEAGTPHAGLESYEAALAALRRIPPERLLALLADSGATFDREEDVFRTNLELYAAGRLATIEAFARWLATRPPSGADAAALHDEVMAELIGARNRAWLARIEAELARGGAFVAVGALHLPGADGLVALLRDRGWTLSRLD
jgi:uncharacterized protein YbaP (TraB family)